MTELSKQAGHYFLKSFKVTKYLDPSFEDESKYVDLKFVIHSFNIIESMSLGSVRGSAAIYDPADLVSRFPLVGEELIQIIYSDFFDVERTEYYMLYTISDVQSARDASQSILSYKLDFVSPGKFFSETFLVAKMYKPDPVTGHSLISDYVKTVYQDYYERPLLEYQKIPPKELVVESTTGSHSLLVPRFTPEETMFFFSRRAFSSSSSTQTYRFFENRDRYYFATNEFMEQAALGFIGYGSSSIDPSFLLTLQSGETGGNITIPGIVDVVSSQPTIPIFRQNYLLDMSPERQLSAMYELINVNYGAKFDTIHDLNAGGYLRTSYEIDIVNGTVDKVAYDHLENVELLGSDKLTHSRDFITARMTKEKERFVIKDFASTGAATGTLMNNNLNYSQLYNVKTSYFHHYNQNKISATIYGRNTLFAGNVLELELFEHITTSNNLKKDDARSGRYWVESIENLFYENIYTQKLVLSKLGTNS